MHQTSETEVPGSNPAFTPTPTPEASIWNRRTGSRRTGNRRTGNRRKGNKSKAKYIQQVHFETFPFKAKQVLIVMVGYGGARCGCHCNNLGSDLDGHDRSGCDRSGSWGGNRCCGAFDGDRGGGSGGDCGGGRLGGRDGCS